METTITIDDALLEAARRHSGEADASKLVARALERLLQTKPIAGGEPKETEAHRPWPMLPPEPQSEVEIFAKIEFFDQLSPAEIQQLLAASAAKTHAPGDLLIQAGESGNSMFVITKGYVEVFVAHAENPDADLAVAKLRAGEFFGEMSLLTGTARSATIRAITTVQTREISKDAFREILATRSELLGIISRIIAERRLRLKLAEGDGAAKTQGLASQVRERMRAFFA